MRAFSFIPIFFRMMLGLLGLTICWSTSEAFDIPPLKIGEGALFELSLSSGKAQVAITVAERTTSEVALEFYFKDLSFTGIEMWQRFHLQPSGKSLKVTQGYVLMPQLGQTFRLDREYLEGFDGAQMTAFMIGSQDEMKKYQIGVEKVSVPAGTVTATHYQIKDRGQTIDYWVDESAKPIGIVQMKSQGSQIKQNYTLQLKALLNHAAAKINPQNARPLTKEAKDFLPKPGTSLLMD